MTSTFRFARARWLTHLLIQILFFILSKIILLPFTIRRFDPSLPKRVKATPHLIIANHRRGLDSFIIGAALPFRIAIKILPMGLMLHNVFYDSILRPFAWLVGCFPAKNPQGKHRLFGVDGAGVLLKNHYSIFIFPEGTRIRSEPRGPARPGVIRIHKAAPEVPFILCHITYHKDWKARLSGRWRTVRYKLVENPSYDDPEKLMDDVFAL